MEKKIDKVMNFSAYAWLMIPIIIFFAGFLKWYVALICLLLFGVSAYFVWKDKESFRPLEGMKYSWGPVLLIAAGIIVWVVLSGIGGFGYQNWDLNFRNAILHDLIDFDWPVYYDYSSQNINHEIYGQTGALAYYLTYYLPSALAGKVFGWQGANIFMLIWSVIGVTLVVYFMCRYVKKVTVFSIGFLIIFSGLDIIGYLLVNKDIPPLTRHIEWWATYFQYSSTTSMLFYVFNQILPAWLVTMLIINQKNAKSMVFTYALCFPFAPFPTLGLFPIVLWRCLFGTEKPVFRWKAVWQNIRNAITIQNILTPLLLLAVFGLYFSCTNVVAAQSGPIWSFGYDMGNVFKKYIALIVLEFLVYAVILFQDQKKNPLFYIAIATMMILPVYKIGENNDFVMRISVPFVLLLVVYALQYFIRRIAEKKWLAAGILAVVLLIGAVTPFQEITRSVKYIIKDREHLVADSYKTYAQLEGTEEIFQFYAINFVTNDPKEKIFFRYLAK